MYPPGDKPSFNTILEKYDRDILLKARRLNKIMLKITRQKCHLFFNHRCKDRQLLPPSLKIRPPVQCPKGYKLAKNTSLQFLKLRIEHSHKQIRKLNYEKDKQTEFQRANMEPDDLKRTEALFSDLQRKEHLRMRTAHAKKLAALEEKSNRPSTRNTIDCKKWVLNISSKPLTDTEESALQKGMNFAIAPKKIPIAEIVAAVEGSISELSAEEKLKVRAQVSEVLSRARPPPSNIPSKEMKDLQDLRKDKSRLIISADKGNCTVVMDRKDYDDKVKELLGDESTYKVLKKDPTKKTERDMNGILLKMKREGTIGEKLYRHLHSSDGLPPRFYGLPKTHKNGNPLRPIVSFISSPTYNLSKYVAKMLKPLTCNSAYTVKNSTEFCGSIADINLQGDDELVSFDVVSLFTSIPVDVAVNIAYNRLVNDENLPEGTALSVTDVIKLLDFCLSTTNFQYGHEHYQQIHGTAMGSPVSAVMANMVMEDLEERALTTLTNQPLFWKRFVDDVSTTTKFDGTQTFLEHLNSIEPCIKFTVERENEGKIAFNDTMVHHQEDGRLTTTVYRKPTHTDRYLSFSSHHPSMHKLAVVKSLMDRAERIPTTKSDRSKEKQRVISTLQSNGYPKRFILDAKQA